MRKIFAWTIITFPLFLLGDFSSYFSGDNGEGSAIEAQSQDDKGATVSNENVPKINESNKKFVFTQYQTATQEIRNRIEQEHLLFALKFTIVGGVLGVIFWMRKKDSEEELEIPGTITRSPYVALCLWTAVAVAAIMDARMVFNVNIINELGGWVYTIESSVLPPFQGWEHFYAQSKFKTSLASPLLLIDRQLLTWVLFIVAFFLFVVEPSIKSEDDNHRKAKLKVLRVSMYANPLCYLLFGFVGIHFYYDETWKIGTYFLVLIIFAVLSTSYIYWLRNKLKQP